MKYPITHKIITYLIASVWFINGFYCKLLNQVPRHEAIVAQVLNTEYSREITILIGILEVCLAFWIVSKYKQKLTAIFQIFLILIMNMIEFTIVPELLLWGKYNIIFALLFIIIIYINNFYLNKTEKQQHGTNS